MTIAKYYEGYKSLFGVLAAVVAASPLISLIPIEGTEYIYPPLGDMGAIAKISSIALAVAVTFGCYFYRPKMTVSAVLAVLASFALFCVIYVSTYFMVVRKIDIPSKQTSFVTSIGFTRSKFAMENFKTETDEEMIRDRGLSEEEIRHLWTPSSVLLARMLLWASLSLAIASLTAAFGMGIRSGAIEDEAP